MISKLQTREILNRYPPGSFLSKEDNALLQEVFAHHPRAKEKIGVGIQAIEVERNTKNKNVRQFRIHRFDATSTDISYLKCFTGELSKIRLFKVACRTSVEDQIKEFRSRFSPDQNNGTHVDHHPKSFNRIVQEFISSNTLDVEQVQILGWEDNETEKKFADPQLEKQFADFHRAHATLRLITI